MLYLLLAIAIPIILTIIIAVMFYNSNISETTATIWISFICMFGMIILLQF